MTGDREALRPDRYGPCDCVAYTSRTVADAAEALDDLIARHTPAERPRVADTPEPQRDAALAAGRDAHRPVLTPGIEGEWGVYCLACSHAAGDYVSPCEAKDQPWPGGAVVPARLLWEAEVQRDAARADALALAQRVEAARAIINNAWPGSDLRAKAVLTAVGRALTGESSSPGYPEPCTVQGPAEPQGNPEEEST